MSLQVNTLYELFDRSVKKFAKNPVSAAALRPERRTLTASLAMLLQCLGTRKPGSEYVFKTYEAVGEEVANIASGLKGEHAAVSGLFC